MYAILVVALIFIQREVLIDILYIWPGLVAGVIRFRAVVRIGRITLGVVDSFVALKYTLLFVVEIRTAIIMVVVASRVVTPGLENTVVGDDAAKGVNPLLISTELPLLFVVQTIEAHILQSAGTRGCGEGIGLRSLLGNASPLGVGK